MRSKKKVVVKTKEPVVKEPVQKTKYASVKKTWKYFNKSEFACPCCGKNDMNEGLIDMLDEFRGKAEFPFIIKSGFRCQEHNKLVGGAESSAHLTGEAVDIKCGTSQKRFKLLNIAIELGFKRIGVAETFVHVDIAKDRPQDVVWTY